MAQNDKYCRNCGTKYDKDTAPIRKSDGALIFDVVNKDLHLQRKTFGDFLGQIIWLVIIVVFGYFFNPAVYICGIFVVLNILRYISYNRKRKKLSYYVLERPCLEKKVAESDDSPDELQLWFSNGDGSLHVGVSVEEDFYNNTEIGEEFYVVFLTSDKVPCLCYRKSEWNSDIK